MTIRQTTTLAATLASTLVWAALGLAQEPGKARDEVLDKLLRELEQKSPAEGKAKPAEDDKDKDKDKEKSKPAEGEKGKANAGSGSGEVAPKDKALDSLLEKLGETRDTPSPDDRPKGGPGGPPQDEPPAKPDKEKPAGPELKGKAKDLDEHLEELTGRKRKKKDRDDGSSGALGQVIKQMRDVEERLGKPDTGEETRKKQEQIVKNLETLIEQLKASGQSSRRVSLRMRPGQQPGSKSGQTPGAQAGQAPNQRPEKPTGKHVAAGGKDEWGHLPPELRQLMDNVMAEEGLPNKAELIRRYYLSLSKKILVRGE
jgi:hypothetical protein